MPTAPRRRPLLTLPWFAKVAAAGSVLAAGIGFANSIGAMGSGGSRGGGASIARSGGISRSGGGGGGGGGGNMPTQVLRFDFGGQDPMGMEQIVDLLNQAHDRGYRIRAVMA